MKKRLMSLALVLSMVISMVPTVFATENEPAEATKYVSLGDSMTNGYGLDGYEEPDGNGNITNWFGFQRNDVEGSYPWKVAHNYGWTLSQLATSGLRADDVYYLLNLGTDYEVNWDAYGRAFMAEKFGQSYKDAHNGQSGSDEAIIAYAAGVYQAEVKDADVISIGIGSNNFATLMDMRMMWWMGRILGDESMLAGGGYSGKFDFNELVSELPDEMKAEIADLYTEAEQMLMDAAAEADIPMDAPLAADGATMGDLVKDMANAVAYTTAGFALGYKGIIDTIIRENDDAEIIIVGLTNWFRGMVYGVPVQGEMFEFPMGDLMELVCDFAGVYMAALPAAYEAAAQINGTKLQPIYFADTNAKGVEDVELIVDEIVDNTADVDLDSLEGLEGEDRFEAAKAIAESITSDAIPEGTTRDRLLQAMGQYVMGMMGMRVPSMADVKAYEAYVNGGYITSTERNIAVTFGDQTVYVHTYYSVDDEGDVNAYFDEEYDIIPSSIALEDWVTEEDLNNIYAQIFGGADPEATLTPYIGDAIRDAIYDAVYAYNAGCIAYLGLEKSMISSLHLDVVNVEHFQVMSSVETLMDVTWGALEPHMSADPNDIAGALIAVPELGTVSNLMFNFLVGSGVIVHPSDDGHTTISEVIIDAYDNKWTATNETLDNLKQAADLVAEYYDEAYAYAYAYAADAGYIDAAVDGIDAAIEMFNNLDLSEIKGQMTAELYAEIEADIAAIVVTLEKARALVLEADVLDQPTLDALMETLGAAGNAAWELLCTLEQAGVDVNEYVIIPELKKAHAFLINEVIPQIDYQLQIAVKAGAEWLKEQAEELAEDLIEMLIEALPGVDAALYDWLYNNPDKVIAFFAEYGDDIVALTEEYGENAMGILAYIAFTYGDEVIAYVIENPCETVELLVKWYDKYGYRIWPMVDVYLEELGVYEDIGAAFEALDQMMIALAGQFEDQIEKQIETIIEQMETQLEILKGQLENLNEQLMGAVGEIEQEILAAIEKIEAAIEAIEKAIEDLIEIVEDIKDTVESIMAAVEDVADVIEALKALDNSYINEILAVLEETGLELMFNYMFLYTAYLDKCELGEDLDYVALGGATVANELYAETVAAAIDEAIGLPVTYTGAGSADLTYKTQMEYIMANAEAIADAELISYQQDANEIVDALLEVVLAVNLGGDYIAPDWSEYVDVKTIADVKANVETAKAELLPYLPAQIIDTIAEAEADITAKLTEQVDAETAEQLKPYVEQLVYSLVSYAVETAEAVEAIQAINENAPVLLVGMYNMLDGVVVKMNGTEIDLGEYFDYVIKAVDMYNVVYGVTTGNVTIVDVCEASVDEIVFDADELIGLYAEVEELMVGLNGIALDQIGTILEKIDAIKAKIAEAMFTLESILTNSANEDGIAYIAEQIADSLLVFDHIEEYEYDDEYHWLVCTYCGMVGESGKHEYDNSKDATCNVCDYERVIKKPASGGSSVGGSFFTNPFSDVNKSDYFYKAVMWAVQQGITAGIGDGQFGPHIDCTRAQVVTMLWRAAGSPRVTAENPFTDVSVNDYYYNAVLWAVKEGITAGTSATTFSPNKTCSRAEIMTFVWKAIGAPAAKGSNTFADVAADAYYATAVIWAAENGVTAGTGANTFSPEMICSRAQTVTFLWKVYGG